MSARPRSGRGLRRVGVLQARATAAHRRGAGVAGRPQPSDDAHRPPALGRRARAGTARSPSTRRPPPIRCPAAPWSPWSPAARSSSPARRSRISPGCVATTAADADVLHRLAAAAGLRRRAGPPTRTARRSACSELPRYRAMEQSFDRIGPHGRSAMCSTAAVQVCVDAGERSRRRRPLGRRCTRSARCCSRRSRTRPRLHGRRTGWKSTRWAVLDARRPRAHRAARRSRTPSTRPRTGRGACWTPRCCACGGTAAGWCPRGSRSPTGCAAREPAPTDRRRPRLPPVHAVPAGAPPRPPRGALHRHAARQAVGAARSPCSRRCCPTRGVIDVVPRRLRPGARPLGLRGPPRAGRPRPRPSGRPGVRAGGRPPTRSRRPRVAHRRARRHDRTARPARPVPRRRAGRSFAVTTADAATVPRGAAHPHRRPPHRVAGPQRRAHRRRRRRRSRRAALAADVAAGLGPRAHRQPGGAVAGARRRRPRRRCAPRSTTSTTRSSTPGRAGSSCRCSRPAEARAYVAEVRDKVLDVLGRSTALSGTAAGSPPTGSRSA